MERDIRTELLEKVKKQKAIIIVGSPRDVDTDHVLKMTDELKKFGVDYDLRIGSAHKTPVHLLAMLDEYVSSQSDNEYVFITVAGLSNALSGFTKGALYHANPPITVIASPPFNEIDIWSSLRVPAGVPVPTITDPRNAALFVVEQFAKNNPRLAKDYCRFIVNEFQKPVLDADCRIFPNP